MHTVKDHVSSRLTISQSDFQNVTESIGLNEVQIEHLWVELKARAGANHSLNIFNLLYYLGGGIVLLATVWLSPTRTAS